VRESAAPVFSRSFYCGTVHGESFKWGGRVVFYSHTNQDEILFIIEIFLEAMKLDEFFCFEGNTTNTCTCFGKDAAAICS